MGALLIAVAVDVLVSRVITIGIPGPQTAALFGIVAGAVMFALFLSFFLKVHDAIDTVGVAQLWHPAFLGSGIALSLLYQVVSYFMLIAVFSTDSPGSGSISIATAVLVILLSSFVTMLYAFPVLVSLDSGAGPLSAIDEGVRLMRGSWLKLYAFFVVCYVLIVCIVTIPIALLAIVQAYRTLQARTLPVPLS